jgi:hypothetical protein
MAKNIEGFLHLLLIISTSKICIDAPKEVIHLLAINEYGLGLFILAMAIISFIIGANSYGYIKNQIKMLQEK